MEEKRKSFYLSKLNKLDNTEITIYDLNLDNMLKYIYTNTIFIFK